MVILASCWEWISDIQVSLELGGFSGQFQDMDHGYSDQLENIDCEYSNQLAGVDCENSGQMSE